MSPDQKSRQVVDEMLSYLNPTTPLVDYEPNSKVASFYSNRTVFITGATGFLGKALIEKLLRSCKTIKKIYVLIREKRGKSIKERLNDLIQAQNFDRIRANNNGSNQILEEKLHAIQGDITLPKFGISEEDTRLLSKDCSIVFNSAATIRFVEPIDVAVRNNIYSVGQLVEFCDLLENLEALIHLSTAYSNCHKKDTIYEIFYEPPMRGDQIQDAIKELKRVQDRISVYTNKSKRGGSEDDDYDVDDDDDDDDSSSPPSRSACRLQKFYHDNAKFSPNPLNHHGQATRSQGGSTPNGVNKQLVSSSSSASIGARQNNSPNQFVAGFDLLDEFTRIALRRSNRPNTYTFTKAISETYLLDCIKKRPDRYLGENKIPVAILRPSIVGAAWREPAIGLVDNFNGPTGAILSLYTGALQAMPGRGERVADLVPVDMVTNMIICSGWYLATVAKQGHSQASAEAAKTLDQTAIKCDQGAYIFNMVSGYRNPLHWHQVTDKIAELAYKFPSKFLTRLPSSYFIEAGKKYELYDQVNQKFPAHLMDFVRSKLLRQSVEGRSSARVSYARIKQMTDTLTPFTSNQWRLSDSNVRALYEQLDDVDKKLFHFNVTAIDWTEYLRNYIIGARIYTLKDEASNVPKAMKSLRRRQYANCTAITILLMMFYYFIICGSQLESLILGTTQTNHRLQANELPTPPNGDRRVVVGASSM